MPLQLASGKSEGEKNQFTFSALGHLRLGAGVGWGYSPSSCPLQLRLPALLQEAGGPPWRRFW